MSAEQYRLFDSAPVASPALASVPTGDVDGLRPYQREAVDAALAELAKVRATLGVAHCGAGKTQIGGAIIKAFPGRILWLAHRDFLLSQARARIMQMCAEDVSVEKAEQRMEGTRVVVGSVQTMRGERLRAHAPDKFSLIIVDEAHHATAPGYRAVFDHFASAKAFGITATPKRHDKIGQWNVFESVAFQRDVDVGVAEGYFCPIVPVSRMIDSIDLSKVKTTAGDLNLGDLEAQIAESAAAIAQIAFEEAKDRPTLIYTPGVASAHAVADTLNQLKPGSARSVDQDTDVGERAEALRDFASGKIQFIANCAIYIEGLDVPNARCIVIARPTKSQGLYVQMAGRGGRPEGWIGQLDTVEQRLAAIAASSKPNFLLLDITGHPGRHSLVTAANALAGKRVPDAVKDRAADVLAKKPGTTLDEALTEAQQLIDAEDEEQRQRIATAAARAAVKARRGTFDPFRRFGLDEPKERGAAPKWAAEPADAADRAWMRKNKLLTKEVDKKLTKGTVRALQEQAKKWLREDMASFRQRNSLSRAGCPVNVRWATASRMIDVWIKQGWRKLTGEQIEACQPSEPGEDG